MLYFWKIGVDPIPDWVSNLINNNIIILKSPSGNISNSPFENFNDTYIELYLPNYKPRNVEHGDFLVKKNNDIFTATEEYLIEKLGL